MIEQQNNIDMACFEVNEHGRILSGNRRFCRMFGYGEDEIMWHYITDFYRYKKEWDAFKNCDNLTQHHFVARMKNRKGRSFKCSISREVIQDEEGRIVFRNYVSRVGEDSNVVVKEAPVQTRSVVFVAKCGYCGNHVRVNTLAETRMRVLCDTCAMKAYPEAFSIKAAQM
ncbi:PAS domain-containing protein [Fibrobacter sp.]|uniref:PAS domain-containing protein n=1 Tax=Fibrobacter sp. TaxID=35828 RepID=UPI00388D5103